MSVVPDQTAEGRLVSYADGFYDQLIRWRDEHPEHAPKVVRLIEEVILTPGTGIGRPKRINGLKGVWTRRITRHHRLVYLVTDDELMFVSCHGHDLPGWLYEECGKGPKG